MEVQSGYGGEAIDEEKEFRRAARIRTDGGEAMRVYPLTKVSLAQAVVLVADGKVYCLEAVWEDMVEKDKDRFRWVARGAGWIDNDPEAVSIPGVLARGGRWCTHKGFSDKVRGAIKDLQVMAFGTVRPSQQSAGMVVVGGDSKSGKHCGTCGGVTEASRQCSPNGSGFGAEELEVVASRQLRRESKERTTRDKRQADRQLRGIIREGHRSRRMDETGKRR